MYVWASGHMDIWASGLLGIWTSGHLHQSRTTLYKPLKRGLCKTYNQLTGENKCITEQLAARHLNYQEILDSSASKNLERVPLNKNTKLTGDCISFDEEFGSCDCHHHNKNDVVYPVCQGECIVNCRNTWNEGKFLKETCRGAKFCTCTEYGAICE